MRVGILSPVVTQEAGLHSPWERTAGIEEIAAIARVADELGYSHLTCSDHVAIPWAQSALRSSTYWAPAPTLGYLASCTKRIRLLTCSLVLGFHHPLEIAKTYGTLDRISGGRLILGFGIGSIKEEFEMLGVSFDDRGGSADDSLQAIRSSFGLAEPSYSGDRFHFEKCVVAPHGVQPHVSIWLGGQSHRALERAVKFADGWMPMARDRRPEHFAKMIAKIELPPGFDVILYHNEPIDPGGAAARTADIFGRLAECGATVVNCYVSSRSVDHYKEQLLALAELANVAADAPQAPRPSPDPHEGVPVPETLEERVQLAVARGASWHAIGRALGTDAESAQRRFSSDM